MNAIFQKNKEVIQAKWPQILSYLDSLDGEINVTFIDDMPEKTVIFNGSHLSSCYNRLHEAKVQNSAIPKESSTAYLYGVGLGDAVYDLLERPALNKLEIYLLSPMLFCVYLNLFDATAWLNDERIHLHLAHKPVLHKPYSVNAAELSFTEDAALPLKNKIEDDKNQRNLIRLHQVDLASEYKNNVRLNQSFLEKDPYVELLRNKHQGAAFVVVAGGPTANEQFDWMREQRKDTVVISASTGLIALEQANIIPDYVIALDKATSLARHFQVSDKANYHEVTLVYTPTTSPHAVQLWSGQRSVCLIGSHPFLKKLYKQHPKSVLYTGGSVAHSAVDLAVFLGAKSITLVGFDFCFAYGQSHLVSHPNQQPKPAYSDSWVLNGNQQKVPTTLNLVGYKEAMEEYIAAHSQLIFYNTGREGAEIKGAKWIR